MIYDTGKLDSQPCRYLDLTEAEKEFEFKTKTRFGEGLKRAIEWHKNNYITKI